MTIRPAATVPAIARNGLDASQGAFLRGTAIRRAEQALGDVVELAGDRSPDAAVARVGRAVADAASASPAARLAVLRQTLTTLEGGVVAGVGHLSQMSYKLLDAMDGAKVGAPRAEAVRAGLDAIAAEARAEGAPQADYAGFIARLGHEVPNPVYTLNMLDRVNCAEVGDVTRPAWYASVGFSFATGAVFDNDAGQLSRILGVVDPTLQAQTERRGDATTAAHLDRERAWDSALALSPAGRLALHLATLRLAGDEVACRPETALVLAWQTRHQSVGMAGDERERVVEHGFAEARQAALPPDSPAARWLRFHDEAAAIGASEPYAKRLRETAFMALVEGRQPTRDTLQFELAYGLEKLDRAGARRLFEAVERLVGAGESDDALALDGLDLHRRAATTQPEVANVFLECAWERIVARPSDRADRNALVEMTHAALATAADAERPALMADALERLRRLDTDKVQQAIVRAATSPPATAGTVRQEDDYVMIGSVKVPRKAVQR